MGSFAKYLVWGCRRNGRDMGQHRTNDDLHLATASPGIDTGPSAVQYQDLDTSQNDRGAYGGPEALP